MFLGPKAGAIALLSSFFLLACGDDDDEAADIAGEYTIHVTNGESTCPLQDWAEGEVSSNIPLTITQEGNRAEAELGGVTAVVVDLLLGEGTFEGTVSGNGFTLRREGTRAISAGACAFTVVATATATLDGDAIQGTIRYAPNTNDSPDCAGVAGCSAIQNFNGVRPPR